MTEKELEISNRSYDILAAVGVGLGVMTLGGMGYLLLGVCTRVIGICSGASARWMAIYDSLWLFLPIPGVAAGWLAHRKFKATRRKELESGSNYRHP